MPAAIAVAAAIVVAATAQTPEPSGAGRENVVVAGQTLTEGDLNALSSGLYSLKVGLIEKKPGDMPAFDPFVHYAGRTTRSPSRPIVWYSSDNRLATNEAEQAAINQATTAAFVAAELDFGVAGPTLQSMYAKASTAQARSALAESVAQAFTRASDEAQAAAESKTEQIRAQILPGASRADAYAVLRSIGLAPAGPLAGPDADALITIWGSFSLVPECGGRTQVILSFDSSDRVKSVTIDGPHNICV